MLTTPPAEEPASTGVLTSSAVLVIRMQSARGTNEVLGENFVGSVIKLGFERVRAALRDKDQAYGLSNSECVVILDSPGTPDDALRIGRRLVDLIQRAYVMRGQMLYLHARAGVTMAGEAGSKTSTLLEEAGTALKFAALGEPGTVLCFESKMDEQIRSRQCVTGELRKALLLKQLEVHYQPQVRLPDCSLIGFEALLRWKHPKLGWISPAEFIPLAEEIGIIAKIGGWVLRTACRQAALLPAGITMAVNASPMQLMDGSLLEAADVALQESALAPERLEIEITEGILVKQSNLVLSVLGELHRMGVKLAIDDFGTGYSSFGQLAHLPFDRLKIDRSLIGHGKRGHAIVRAITTLGAGLEMATLIEGVETLEDLENACLNQCDSAQGFFFGRAVPAVQLDDVIRTLQPDKLRLRAVAAGDFSPALPVA